MKSIIKSAALTVFLASMLCITPERAYPIGEFSVGVNLGFTYDPNNLEEEMSRYNMVMESFKEANTGSSATQLSIPYAPVFGVNLRYQFNFFLFRLGCHYSQPMGGVKGSITPAGGVKNTIEMSTYQISYPATIGLIIPLRERTYFYIGAGATFHSAYVEIKQSNPGQAVGGPPTLQTAFTNAGLSNNRRDRYSENFVGYHFILGAEVPFGPKMTISSEWVHQEGRSYPLRNEGLDGAGAPISTPKKVINVRGDIILFGINYYISI